MKAFACDGFPVPLPEWHRFPMSKYARLRERIERSGPIAPGDLLIPPAATEVEHIEQVANRRWIERHIRISGRGDRVPQIVPAAAGQWLQTQFRSMNFSMDAWS